MKLNLERTNDVHVYIGQYPGCTNADIAENFGFSHTYAAMFTNTLMKMNLVYKREIKRDGCLKYQFFPKDGTTPDPTPVKQTEVQEPKVEKKEKTPDDFTPRELMKSLVKRGYRGRMKLDEQVEVDFENVSIDKLIELKKEGYVGSFTLSKVHVLVFE